MTQTFIYRPSNNKFGLKFFRVRARVGLGLGLGFGLGLGLDMVYPINLKRLSGSAVRAVLVNQLFWQRACVNRPPNTQIVTAPKKSLCTEPHGRVWQIGKVQCFTSSLANEILEESKDSPAPLSGCVIELSRQVSREREIESITVCVAEEKLPERERGKTVRARVGLGLGLGFGLGLGLDMVYPINLKRLSGSAVRAVLVNQLFWQRACVNRPPNTQIVTAPKKSTKRGPLQLMGGTSPFILPTFAHISLLFPTFADVGKFKIYVFCGQWRN
eukprot:sb/3468121/